MSRLPSFLEPLAVGGDSSERSEKSYECALFKHKDTRGLEAVPVQWWPCKVRPHLGPRTVLIFLPGNPGLIEFYTPFLSSIHEADVSGSLAILSHSHIGHTPGISRRDTYLDPSRCGLTAQVHNAIRIFDSVKSAFDDHINIVLVAHSIGSWIALQVLKERPRSVTSVFLLFPAISAMANTPNGRNMSHLFTPPIPRILSYGAFVLRLLPLSILRLFFPGWPASQLSVLQKLLCSRHSIYAALTMAHNEMQTVLQLDTATLGAYRHRIRMYFAEKDDWVGEEREVILRNFQADPDAVRVVHGHRDIPHAFCINHGEELATQCCRWLVAEGYITEH